MSAVFYLRLGVAGSGSFDLAAFSFLADCLSLIKISITLGVEFLGNVQKLCFQNFDIFDNFFYLVHVASSLSSSEDLWRGEGVNQFLKGSQLVLDYVGLYYSLNRKTIKPMDVD